MIVVSNTTETVLHMDRMTEFALGSECATARRATEKPYQNMLADPKAGDITRRRWGRNSRLEFYCKALKISDNNPIMTPPITRTPQDREYEI
jgi:hypothetical protein